MNQEQQQNDTTKFRTHGTQYADEDFDNNTLEDSEIYSQNIVPPSKLQLLNENQHSNQKYIKMYQHVNADTDHIEDARPSPMYLFLKEAFAKFRRNEYFLQKYHCQTKSLKNHKLKSL